MVKGIVERQRVGWEVCGLTDVELEPRGTLRASEVVFEQIISDSFWHVRDKRTDSAIPKSPKQDKKKSLCPDRS